MSEPEDIPQATAHDLELAAAQLRGRPSTLPVEVADRMLERAMAAPRRAQLLLADDGPGHLKVSTVALVALLRQRLDDYLDHAAVRRVRCEAGRDERLEAITVELVVEFGHDVRRLAEEARALLDSTLVDALGPEVTAGGAVRSHVHVSDVTQGDPHLVESADET